MLVCDFLHLGRPVFDTVCAATCFGLFIIGRFSQAFTETVFFLEQELF